MAMMDLEAVVVVVGGFGPWWLMVERGRNEVDRRVGDELLK